MADRDHPPVEVIYDPNEEAELERRLAEIKAGKRTADVAGDDFSRGLSRWIGNQGEDAGAYQEVVQSLPDDPDDAMEALVAGLGGALGTHLIGGSSGAGIGAALATYLFKNARRQQR